ncbi:MAG: glycerophosphodiester phosphodiesterase [Solirubrobacterales bacterium]|nr:glycerophosphodiester phosphodiesterase [Solirubrobacterales bacterium]
MNGPLLIAHRGTHDPERENTLAAFQAAVEAGADYVEMDVRRTKDDRLVVFHDAEVAKTPISKLTHAELIEASKTQVPELEEVLAWGKGTHLGLDVELKEHGYVERVIPLLEGYAEGDNKLFVSSFQDPVVHQLSELAPHLKTGLLFSMTTLGALRRIRETSADVAILEMKLCKEAVVAELAEAGIETWVWDFFPARSAHAPWLEDARIDAFITDDIPGIRAKLAR